MSYLALAKQAEARLRAARDAESTHEKNEFTKEGHAPDVAEALAILGTPLDMFARAGTCLEVRVRWLDVTLWFVPTDRDVLRLSAEGISRGRIWTAAELTQLMAIGARTSHTAKTLAHAKLAMDGGIIEVRPLQW